MNSNCGFNILTSTEVIKFYIYFSFQPYVFFQWIFYSLQIKNWILEEAGLTILLSSFDIEIIYVTFSSVTTIIRYHSKKFSWIFFLVVYPFYWCFQRKAFSFMFSVLHLSHIFFISSLWYLFSWAFFGFDLTFLFLNFVMNA